MELRDLDIGCRVNRSLVGCVLKADYAISIFTSVKTCLIAVSRDLKLDFCGSKCANTTCAPKFYHQHVPLYLNKNLLVGHLFKISSCYHLVASVQLLCYVKLLHANSASPIDAFL